VVATGAVVVATGAVVVDSESSDEHAEASSKTAATETAATKPRLTARFGLIVLSLVMLGFLRLLSNQVA